MIENVQINGLNGVYDKKIQDPSIRYGRNAVENHVAYLEEPIMKAGFNPAPILDFSSSIEAVDKNIDSLEKFAQKNDEYLDALPPLEYEYRYMPNVVDGNIDKKALLGAAYEEMNGVKELPVEEFERHYLIDDTMTAKPMDVNNDGKIDIAEYGTNILATDLLSKGTTDVSKIDGTINTKGMNSIIEYTSKANAKAASKLYLNIYNTYYLGTAMNELEIE